MALRCLTGHIGYGGVMYATGDVFDVNDPMVEQSLVDDGDAEVVMEISDTVKEVVETIVAEEPEAVVKDEQEVVVDDEPEKSVRGRKKR